MIVIPCSMGTLERLRTGSATILWRVRRRMLKEGRKLVLCVRDTPFNRVHLENMLRAQRAGRVDHAAVPRSIIIRKRSTIW